MSAQLLLDDPKTHRGLAFDNCTFECPLGVDSSGPCSHNKPCEPPIKDRLVVRDIEQA